MSLFTTSMRCLFRFSALVAVLHLWPAVAVAQEYGNDPAYDEYEIGPSSDEIEPGDEDGAIAPGEDFAEIVEGEAPPVEISEYYDVLAPHGRWTTVKGLGWVWVPRRAVVGVEFTPYATAGHWTASSHGWMFVSDWSWGWLPFHYGRWFAHSRHGWAWVPGRVWAPAWVRWRHGGGYVGWAPAPPAPRYFAPNNWVFVRDHELTDRRIHYRRASHRHWRAALRTTVPLRDVVRHRRVRWYRGPAIRVGPRRVSTVRIVPPSSRRLVQVRVKGRRVDYRPWRVKRWPRRKGRLRASHRAKYRRDGKVVTRARRGKTRRPKRAIYVSHPKRGRVRAKHWTGAHGKARARRRVESKSWRRKRAPKAGAASPKKKKKRGAAPSKQRRRAPAAP